MKSLLDTIYSANLELLQTSTPHETYECVVYEAVKLANADYGTLFLGDGDNLTKVFSTSSSFPSGLMPRKKGYTYQSYINGKVLVLKQEDVLSIHPEMNKRMKSYILIPLFHEGKPTGVLNLQSRRPVHRISRQKLHALKLYGSIASLAVRKIQAQHEMQQALETRDMFISMAAHEFRTPLTVIKLYIQILLKKYRGKKVEESKWVESLSTETNRLIRLVNELLHVDQVRTGRLKYVDDVCHLKAVIQDAITDSRINYNQHSFILHDYLADNADLVMADENKLLQVFINLLNNAAKFSPPQGAIEVSLSKDGHHLLVNIKDSGLGIPEEEMNLIFNAFYKGTQNQTKEGMGLGLSLVKRIVEHSRGTINVVSKVNQGTEIAVRLPQHRNSRRVAYEK